MTVRSRRRHKPISMALNGDYAETLPAGLYRSLSFKASGVVAASGAGTNAGDGPFGLIGRVEWVRNGTPIISMHAADLRHLTAFLASAYPEILPASIANPSTFLAQAELPLEKIMPDAGVDARKVELVVRGRVRGATNLGSTVTSLTSGKIRGGGDTDESGKKDYFEPSFFQKTIDTSSAGAELTSTHRITNDVEMCAALMLRCFDSSLELSDPNTYRSDGMVREIKVTLEREGQPSKLVKQLTWGEAKLGSTTLAGISAATGQIQTGVVLVPIEDPDNPGSALRLVAGDALNVVVDTLNAVEDEFTALTPAAGDQVVVSFLNFVPKGPGVDAVKAKLRR